MSAFTFDLIDASGYGYHRVWTERGYLLRLAAIPLILKFACAIIALVMGYNDDFLKRGLFSLPAMFAEGWVMAQFLRTLLMEERWPFAVPDREDEAEINRLILRARGIISSTLVYVLIMLASTVLGWSIYYLDTSAQNLIHQQEMGQTNAVAEASPLLLVPAVGALLLAIWAFRLLWIYIPYAVLMPARTYLAKLGGFMASIRLIGLFMICMVPVNLLGALVVHTLMSPYGERLADAPPAISFVIIMIGSFADIIVSLIATAAMAYAMRDIIPHHPDALKDVQGTRR